MSIVTKGVRDAQYYVVRILAVGKMSAGRAICPALEFLGEQHESKPNELSKLTALLEHTALEGVPKNEEKFKKVEGSDHIFEFKSYQMRLFCFFDEGKVIVCANGAVKKRDRANPHDIEKAEEWRSLYFRAKADKTLQHLHGH